MTNLAGMTDHVEMINLLSMTWVYKNNVCPKGFKMSSALSAERPEDDLRSKRMFELLNPFWTDNLLVKKEIPAQGGNDSVGDVTIGR